MNESNVAFMPNVKEALEREREAQAYKFEALVRRYGSKAAADAYLAKKNRKG